MPLRELVPLYKTNKDEIVTQYDMVGLAKLSLIKMECNAAQFAKLRSIRHYVGLPIDGRSVTTELLKQEGR